MLFKSEKQLCLFVRPTEAQSATPGKNQVDSAIKKKIHKFMEKQGLGHSKAILAKWLKICFCLWSIVNQSGLLPVKRSLMKVHVKHGELFLNKTTKVKKSLIKTVLISI